MGKPISLAHAPEASLQDIKGKIVQKIYLDIDVYLGHDVLIIEFSDGQKVGIADTEQCCCEHRYITCDDDLTGYQGAHLEDISLREGRDDIGDGMDCHEVAFVKVVTDQGTITLTSHNEHNGYYGGFDLAILALS